MPRKTLADTLAARETVYVNCGHPMCCKSTKLDIQALIDRLGSDHGSMHRDLVGLFGCSKCKAEGRDRRPVFFTFIPRLQRPAARAEPAPGSRPSKVKGSKRGNLSSASRFVWHVPSRATTHIAKG
jgi:hypothetical protein